MKTPSTATKKALSLMRAIEPEQLPAIINRTLAATFALVSPRTLIRAEERGELTPIKRNRRSVAYEKDEFLKWYGLQEEQIAKLHENQPEPQEQVREQTKSITVIEDTDNRYTVRRQPSKFELRIGRNMIKVSYSSLLDARLSDEQIEVASRWFAANLKELCQ